MSELPPGFVLDEQPKQQPSPAGLPDGFVLDTPDAGAPSVVGSVGRGAVRGASLGFQDELSGLAASAPGSMGERERRVQKYYAEGGFPSLPDPISVIAGGVNRLFGNRKAEYDAAVAQQRAMAEADRKNNPIASIAGEVIGGIALPVGTITTAAQGMKTGAVLGGLYGFGEGEGFDNSAGKALQNAAIGGALGGVVGRFLGPKANKPNTPPPASPVADEAAEFGIGLTSGQKTGDIAALTRENAMLGGGRGERAQQIAQQGATRQAAEIEAARAGIGSKVGGREAAQPVDVAGEVVDSIRSRAAQGREGVRQAYDAAAAKAGEFSPKAITGIGRRIRDKFAQGTDYIITPETTPVAMRALSILDDAQRLVPNKAGNPAQPGDTVVGISMQGIDATRKRLQALARGVNRTMPEDGRAVRQIINEFDGQIEQAMTNGLFRGDESALAAMKEARAKNAEWYKTFRASGPGDDAGKFIAKMADPAMNVTPVEAANMLYGLAKVGERGASVRVAGKLKTILGDGSPEWAALRQATWTRLTDTIDGKDAMGAQKLAGRIIDFVSGNGAPMAREMFTKPELDEMIRFARVVQATVAPRNATNPPNSGNRIMGLLSKHSQALVDMLSSGAGAMMAGPYGAVAGIGAAKAVQGVSNWRKAVEASRAFSGDLSIPLSEKLATGAARAGVKLPRLVSPVTADMALIGRPSALADSDNQK